jgi:hypothetical protein
LSFALLALAAIAAWSRLALRLVHLALPAAPRLERAAIACVLGAAGLASLSATASRWLVPGTRPALAVAAAFAVLAQLHPALRRTVAAAAGERSSAGDLALHALGALPAIAIALTYHTGDWSAHYWNAAAIERGVLPLRYPSDPALPLTYHYAIDLLAALLGFLLPIDPEWRFDLLSVGFWLCASAIAAGWVRALGSTSRVSALAQALAFALLGGGAAWLVAPWTHNEGEAVLRAAGFDPFWFRAGLFGAFTNLGQEILNFPALHYFFNPPMALGIPLGLAVARCYSEWSQTRDRAAFAAVALGLGSLGLAHVAWLAVLGAAIALDALLAQVARAPAEGASSRAPLRDSALLLASAALVAVAAGGGVELAAGAADPSAFAWLRGLRLSLAELPAYYLASFGVAGLLGTPAALSALTRGGPARLLACIAAVGFATPQLVWYQHSNVDNLKFFCISALALGLLAAPSLGALRRALPGPAGLVGSAVIAAASIATPLLHTALRLRVAPDYVLTLVRHETPPGPRLQPHFDELWPAMMQAAAWLAAELGPRDLLLVASGNPDPLYAASRTGVFVAEPRYAGYPALALPQAWLGARTQWYERARRFEHDALCAAPAPALWILADESALGSDALRALRAAVGRGDLRPVYSADDTRARARVFRACATGDRADATGRSLRGAAQ